MLSLYVSNYMTKSRLLTALSPSSSTCEAVVFIPPSLPAMVLGTKGGNLCKGLTQRRRGNYPGGLGVR